MNIAVEKGVCVVKIGCIAYWRSVWINHTWSGEGQLYTNRPSPLFRNHTCWLPRVGAMQFSRESWRARKASSFSPAISPFGGARLQVGPFGVWFSFSKRFSWRFSTTLSIASSDGGSPFEPRHFLNARSCYGYRFLLDGVLEEGEGHNPVLGTLSCGV